ncbi:MAG TPA: hypothetical protein VLN45_01550, partial [Ignavibacteriaceae bacterium]|nr:hypothetical protein [Ignavibacteriaceae bacterium]
SLEALSEVESSIEDLRNDFTKNKELLDKSLYPDNFDKTIQKLKSTFALRQGDFTQIDVLHTEVTGLREDIDTLNRRNQELTVQFNELEKQTGERIASLEKTIARLNASLKKRDEVVMSMIDSLLPPSFKEGDNLTSQEKQQVLSEAEKTSVLYNIKRAVNDNIRFLEATRLQPDDIEDLKNRQENFTQIWKSVGPTMVDIYSERGKSTNELKDIDDAFTRWHSELNREVWESINDEFTENNINLQNFSNGKEFTAVVTNYIDDEIKNADGKSDAEAEASYNSFVDSTWNENIESEWIPFLVDNNMLAENDKDSIEVMIASWKDTVYPGGINWLYVIIAVLVIVVLILLFTRKSGRTENQNVARQQP